MENNFTQKINVFIITGFLGSGKTTLLNNLLKQFQSERNIVIENEFGDVNIDKSLVEGNFKKIFEITGGCLCCNLDMELYDALDQIAQMDQRPENLFLETTGIADAGNLSAIFREKSVEEVFKLQQIICVTDVEVVEEYLIDTMETGRQVAASDLVLLNKCEKISSDYLAQVEMSLKRINPYARYIKTAECTLDKLHLFSEKPVRPLFYIETTPGNKELMHSINSILFETESSFDMQKLQLILQTSLHIYYKDIYRIKGFIKNHKNEAFILQSAGKTLNITPVDKQITSSHIVLIGKNLTQKIADRLLKQAINK
jgi:G3E family GTPase